MKINLLLLFLLFAALTNAQTDKRANILLDKNISKEEYQNYLNGIKAQNIGPTIMSGRIVDLEVDPNDDTHFYVAYATGGLWETKNNGTSFESIFNNQSTFGIGDIAVDWKNKKIFVGTGENNSSRSTYAGLGLFMSDDNGKNWSYLGLEETQHIGRIILNPNDASEIWVCAIGHLFTYNKERGVYKSNDGGKTWKQTLFINEKTGVIDLCIDPQNSKTLYAAAWQRERAGWNFEESGEGSGIYKSVDGGSTWNLITLQKSNFPQGKGVGRIGIGVSYQNSNVVYAILDNQDHRKMDDADKNDGLTKDDLRKMSKEEFLKLSSEKIAAYLQDNGFPEEYTVDVVTEKIKTNLIKPLALVEYLEDANSLLFDSPVIGAEIYRSDDGGTTWRKTHEGYLDNMVFTYGYYFGQIRVHPKNDNKFYLAEFFVAKSEDGGKTIENINGDNVHVDHHALWIDPKHEGHLINGNDGGLNITYDDGKNWIKPKSPSVGQFYTVAVDNAENYNVYGGLQDNGVWVGAHTYNQSAEWEMEGKYPYKSILGGDGMQVQIDLRDNNTIYTGWQYGTYYRLNKSTGEEKYITPKHELGERPLRFNWQTPIHLSAHNNDVLYLGANKLYRSFNKGDDFKCISGDLTAGGKPGDVAYGTLASIHESPLQFGLIYTGSDDGLVHVTKDGGVNWTNISAGLPKGYWVKRVVASTHNVARVYVCLSGHTLDDFQSLLFVSEDYGKTWKQLSNGLPNYPVNVIREDPTNKDFLYVGTDNGLYISLNEGNAFFPVKNGMPVVPVHDIAIQNRDADLIAATHGQSLFKLDLEQIREIKMDGIDNAFTFLPIELVKYSERWGSKKKWFQGERTEPTAHFYYFNERKSTDIQIQLFWDDQEMMNKGQDLKFQEIKGFKGLQSVDFELTVTNGVAEAINKREKKDNSEPIFKQAENGKYYLPPGKYKVAMSIEGVKHEQVLEIVKPK